MSKHLHIMAPEGAIAETVLLPGDPLRAKFIAENFLEDAVCYNEVRGMYGYTGTYKGKKVSIQGTGMGLPSHSIYVNELIKFYGAKRLIRIGSAGSYNVAKTKGANVKVGNVLSSDLFYDDTNHFSLKTWADYGVLAVEMETAELYTLAAKNNVEALSILTISDHIFKGEETSPEERQTTFTEMMEIALQLIK